MGQTATSDVNHDITLAGNVVSLEPLAHAHAHALLRPAVVLAPSARLTTVPTDLAAMREYIDAALHSPDPEVAFTGRDLRSPDRRVIGTTRFLDIAFWDGGPSAEVPVDRWRPDGVEIGATWFARSVHARGHNTEAKLLMLDFAFGVWAVRRVTFKTDARNVASRRAIEKLGAAFEGIRRAHKRAADGTVRDSAYYSLLRSEWTAQRPRVVDRLHQQVGRAGSLAEDAPERS